MRVINSITEFTKLIKDTLDEIDDLQAAIEYDEEFMGDSQILIEPLRSQLQALLQSVEQGKHRFGAPDLPLMSIVDQTDYLILPCKPLLTLINQTHRRGIPPSQ